jgi:hypothetical protein
VQGWVITVLRRKGIESWKLLIGEALPSACQELQDTLRDCLNQSGFFLPTYLVKLY